MPSCSHLNARLCAVFCVLCAATPPTQVVACPGLLRFRMSQAAFFKGYALGGLPLGEVVKAAEAADAAAAAAAVAAKRGAAATAKAPQGGGARRRGPARFQQGNQGAGGGGGVGHGAGAPGRGGPGSCRKHEGEKPGSQEGDAWEDEEEAVEVEEEGEAEQEQEEGDGGNEMQADEGEGAQRAQGFPACLAAACAASGPHARERVMLKVKDWPQSQDFRARLRRHAQDFGEQLPLPL